MRVDRRLIVVEFSEGIRIWFILDVPQSLLGIGRVLLKFDSENEEAASYRSC